MNTLTKAAFAAALAGSTAAPAFAAGLGEPAPEPIVAAPVIPVAPSTDWTGGYVGAQIGYGDVSAPGLDGDGVLYGVRGGYDWDFGGWVLGAGVDYDFADIDLGGGPDNLESVARLKLRVGADLGQTLLYATAGAARAEAEIGGVSRSDNGWFAGIGADYMLNQRWTVGGEILTHQFDDFDGSGIDVDATTASVNASFRF
ncbi:hypothetical protein DEA8626_01267 [Defluviimonas aquaemixtae]|uniref:Outer membrane protein beta-barrel domain-containing protein n=1 Tax=Albidovulum aquaemixtae TaxID=1542388 RepID=A0A2R8B5A7_9RHOB|nr:outer membrane beta-barrel protein [Defluviimonas aquaemixtae]SPH17740.1 hypothetical protein DEA8626_01267 [Defluviimonas aquaemixtae]